MSHPSAVTLRAYALGDLPDSVQPPIENHLLSCPVCRDEVLAWRGELVSQVEALPIAMPSSSALPPLRRPEARPVNRSQRLPAAPRWPALALVSAFTLLSLVGLVWASTQHSQAVALAAEQRQVADWLRQPDVKLLGLTDRQQRPTGHLLLLPSREVLFVLPPAPSGKTYQVWVAAHWKRGDPLTPTVRSSRGLLSASVDNNDYICVSLEDVRRDMTNQTRPTTLLGWTML